MRLAQIARRVDTKPQDIRNFIKDKFDIELDADPNTKLEDEQVNAILDHFRTEEPKVDEPVKHPKAETKTELIEEEIDHSIDTDIDSLKELAEEEVEEPKIDLPEIAASSQPADQAAKTEQEQPKKVVEIKYADKDEPVEDTESDTKSFEPVEVDTEAELIAAKAEKLAGLKVVGKIELGDPEPKEEDLPTVDAIEAEIDELDGDLDTSAFPDATSSSEDKEKEAIFAELDAQMEKGLSRGTVKKVSNEAEEVKNNIEFEEDENSIYKTKRGDYRFTAEQKQNRAKSLAVKAENDRIEAQKKKKKRYYQENVATKVKPQVKKPKQKVARKKKSNQTSEQPKGIWQKFLAWLND